MKQTSLNISKTRSLSAPRERANKLLQYPVDCQVISCHQPRDNFPTETPSTGGKGGSGQVHRPAVFGVRYSADGQQLIIASADAAVVALKLPVRTFGGEGSAEYFT